MEFEKLVRDLAAARQALKERVMDLEAAIAQIKKGELPGIRRAAEAAAAKQEALREAIGDHPHLFVKPRTLILHGIRFGFQKGKGEISWGDEAVVIKLIKKNFPEQADILIKTTEKPLKKALALLAAADLKKLGITVEETGDEIFIKATDSEIDKIVNAILKGKEEEDEDAA